MGYDLPVGQKVRVVLAEDDEPTRFWLKLTLQQSQGFEVVGQAADGRSAVDLINENKPDLVLMDIGMPIMDGVEAARLVKESLPETKVIMFTSHDTDDSVFAALSAGADGYCLKTLTAEQLLKAVSSVLEGAAWLDPGIARKVLRAASLGVPAREVDAETKDSASKDPSKAAPGPNPFSLSQREMEVLQLLVEGLSNQEIADKLCLGTETIKTHMRHIMRKLSVSDRTQAAIKAMRQGIV
ncbi:MAG TPA: response regulator transcription factor [Candidatus Melainabacteria bacterium]|nr:response regulator transcription factor [Candidatus Melainabacteria bacterium]